MPGCPPPPALPCLPVCSLVGSRLDSYDVKLKITDVTADANRGDYRLQV
jgi:hypothetical protein